MPGDTTRYSFPYQEDTDAPDGPALGQDLAEQVELIAGGIDDRLAIVEVATATPTGTWANVAAFGTSWANFGGTTWEVARYRKSIGGTVELQGMLTSAIGSNGNSMFTLPAGFRPIRNHLMQACWQANAGGFRLQVAPTGVVTIYALDVATLGAGHWVNLAGCSFRGEQ